MSSVYSRRLTANFVVKAANVKILNSKPKTYCNQEQPTLAAISLCLGRVDDDSRPGGVEMPGRLLGRLGLPRSDLTPLCSQTEILSGQKSSGPTGCSEKLHSVV